MIVRNSAQKKKMSLVFTFDSIKSFKKKLEKGNERREGENGMGRGEVKEGKEETSRV